MEEGSRSGLAGVVERGEKFAQATPEKQEKMSEARAAEWMKGLATRVYKFEAAVASGVRGAEAIKDKGKSVLERTGKAIEEAADKVEGKVNKALDDFEAGVKKTAESSQRKVQEIGDRAANTGVDVRADLATRVIEATAIPDKVKAALAERSLKGAEKVEEAAMAKTAAEYGVEPADVREMVERARARREDQGGGGEVKMGWRMRLVSFLRSEGSVKQEEASRAISEKEAQKMRVLATLDAMRPPQR